MLFSFILFFSLGIFSQKKWTLKECVATALDKNISIQQSKLNVALAKKDVAIAKGNFLPDLNSSASSNVNFGSGFNPISRNRVATTFLGGAVGLNSGVTIFNGYRNTNIYKQAQLGVAASILDLKVIENDISLRIVNGYLNILFAKENLNVAKVQYQITKKQVEATESQFNAGVIAKGELLNIQSTVATNLQNITAQENALDLALLSLAQLMQISTEIFDVQPIDIGTPSANLLYQNSNAVYSKSLQRLPEIKRAELAIDNADINIALSKSAFLPTLLGNLFLSSDYAYDLKDGSVRIGSTLNESISTQLNENLGYGFGFRLNIPVFNRFQTKNRVAKSLINKDIFTTRLEGEKLRLKQTIEQAFLDVKTSLKTYEASKVSLSAQQEAFKNAQERYNYGTMTLFDLDQVRNRFVNAQSSSIRSKYDYVFKTKVLQFYSGELVF